MSYLLQKLSEKRSKLTNLRTLRNHVTRRDKENCENWENCVENSSAANRGRKVAPPKDPDGTELEWRGGVNEVAAARQDPRGNANSTGL